jgi:RNA polymerase sigma-70 factor (ECF subfamily)
VAVWWLGAAGTDQPVHPSRTGTIFVQGRARGASSLWRKNIMEDATACGGFCDAILPLQPGLLRVAIGLTRNVTEARDLVQDALERALREWARFTPGTNARAWVTSILSRLFIDGWRRRRRHPTFVGIDNVELPAESGEAVPEADAVSWETVTDADLEWAIAQLPAPLRQVFELSTVSHLSYVETGAALGIPISTVGTRLMRARRRLRDLLEARAVAPVSFLVDAPSPPECAPDLNAARPAAQSASRSIRARASTVQGVALESRPM